MKNFELTLRTFLLILVVILTLQHAQTLPITQILIMYGLAVLATVVNMFLFSILGLTEKQHGIR